MTAFIFPGQGAQYPGMAKALLETELAAKRTLEEAEDHLKMSLKSLIFEGPEEILKETRNSQVTLFIVSIAILRVVSEKFPSLHPTMCGGLSLGEYSALVAAEKMSFLDGLSLVSHRATFMNQACLTNPGTMAVILGLSPEQVEQMVEELALPEDL